MKREKKAEVVRRLREYDELKARMECSPPAQGVVCRACRRQLSGLERALGVLTPEERLVIQMLDIRREKGNPARLCEILQIEKATVYRKRERALGKLCRVLGKM